MESGHNFLPKPKSNSYHEDQELCLPSPQNNGDNAQKHGKVNEKIDVTCLENRKEVLWITYKKTLHFPKHLSALIGVVTFTLNLLTYREGFKGGRRTMSILGILISISSVQLDPSL